MTREKAIKYLQQLYPNGGHCWLDEQRIEAIGMAIQALQEEPVSKDRLAFKAIPRLLEMLEPNDRAKAYTTRLADALEKEGYITDAKLARESIKVMNGEKVAMATMDEEPVSEGLKEAADNALGNVLNTHEIVNVRSCLEMFKAGAKWQKAHNWKPADGDDLPEIDREVIALLDNDKVVFAHRPNPNGWDGKSLSTGKVEHYTPKTYDNGGWNIPDVKFWLDVELPK